MYRVSFINLPAISIIISIFCMSITKDPSYPTAVFCIIATEFCERFSFCGLRSILSLYLRNVLRFPENQATVIYHVFIMWCYTMPVFGAIYADSYFGRYRTIRNFSLIYLIGNILMCIAAIPVLDSNPVLFSSIGMFLIAIGTGGLKPCVAAFGAEQFRLPEQSDLLRYFFSLFYFSINLGGFIGMIITPILRKSVSCFGDDTCYLLGFGFPAVLMFISILLFILGKNFYKLKMPKQNVMLEFMRCCLFALAEKWRMHQQYDHNHWLDYAKIKFDWKLIDEMKQVCAILLLFIPLPIFWSLFDQQGSRWTFQASHMDGNVMGIQIVPDQMQVINPIIVMTLIPLFDKLFYPYCRKYNFLQNSLHRMALGGITAGFAFVLAGILELILARSYPELPDKSYSSINVVNTLPCSIKAFNPFNNIQLIDSEDMIRFRNVLCHNRTQYKLIIEAPLQCGTLTLKKSLFEVSATLQEIQEDTFIISTNQKNEIHGYATDPIDFQKSISGNPKVRIDFIKNTNILTNVTVTFKSQTGLEDMYFVKSKINTSNIIIVSPYMEIPQGIYECKIRSDDNEHLYETHFHFALGGVYSLIVEENRGKLDFVKIYTMSSPNSVNILWQIPQYCFISVAEIMFGIAGLEFAFTQAPKCMKTITIAGWYLSTAIGNLFVIIVTQLNIFKNQAYEFFLFAMLIVADMVVFIEMASSYQFIQLEMDSSILIRQEIQKN